MILISRAVGWVEWTLLSLYLFLISLDYIGAFIVWLNQL